MNHEDAAYTNRLIHETSPYLRQHAHNPVDWHSWGMEALGASRDADKPILLSIGYSACHWCHVMEQESFENPQIAAVMNENFINIKVDREERPDLDDIYMNAVTAMTGSGGWPMTVFLTPDLNPFYGGTYFPPEDRYGRPGFPRILTAVSQFYRERRADAEEQGKKLQERLTEMTNFGASDQTVGAAQLGMAHEALEKSYDHENGGFGTEPKFPGSMSLMFCLREYLRTGREPLRDLVSTSLNKMAQGGIYDHLGGGFHRYSVDAEWLIPHFEKMLYDNALLTRTYLEAYQQNPDQGFRKVVLETAEYVIREMLQSGGGFYATQDADSEGEEGKFFAWTSEEITGILGDEAADPFCRYYGVEPGGNFEHGTSVLNVRVPTQALAAHLKMDEVELASVLETGRGKLFNARELRVKPGRDDKILTDWNGLMISSLARTYMLFENRSHLAAAEGSMRFILDNLYRDGRLLHVYKDGVAKLNAYLDDYAFLIEALLDLYEATFTVSWLEIALTLTDTMIEQFWDDAGGGFFFTSSDHERLIVRSKNPYDNAVPSGNAVAVHDLIRLSALTGREDYRAKADYTVKTFTGMVEKAPAGFGYLLMGASWLLDGGVEIALIGPKDDPQTLEFLSVVRKVYLPLKVVVCYDPAEGSVPAPLIPLLGNCPLVDGKPVAYVCKGQVCQRPVCETDGLVSLLNELQPEGF